MFHIYGGKTEFQQWETGQLVTCPHMEVGDAVVFRAHGKAYATKATQREVGVWADVPNYLLQEAGQIRVDLGWDANGHLDCRTYFEVAEREKPEDYSCACNIEHGSTIEGFQIGEGLHISEDGALEAEVEPAAQADWSQNDQSKPDFIRNRPVHDAFFTFELEWDGNTEGLTQGIRTTITGDHQTWYKISDVIPTIDQLDGATYVTTENNSTVLDVRETDEYIDNRVYAYGAPLVVKKDGYAGILGVYGETFSFPEAGIYVLDIFRRIYNGQELKQLDPKYIPEAYVNDLIDEKHKWGTLEDRPFGENIVKSWAIEWDGDTSEAVAATETHNGKTTDYCWKVSDQILTKDQLLGATISSAGGDSLTMDAGRTWYDTEDYLVCTGWWYYGPIIIKKAGYSGKLPGYNYTFYFPEAGVYFTAGGRKLENSEVIPLTQIDPKFIPCQTSDGRGLLLLSSTEGSEKTFKITVDDTGTLTATEVT